MSIWPGTVKPRPQETSVTCISSLYLPYMVKGQLIYNLHVKRFIDMQIIIFSFYPVNCRDQPYSLAILKMTNQIISLEDGIPPICISITSIIIQTYLNGCKIMWITNILRNNKTAFNNTSLTCEKVHLNMYEFNLVDLIIYYCAQSIYKQKMVHKNVIG